jgi:tetratricopeptide (TPR) repeat protein
LEGTIENFQEHPDVLIIRNNMAICHMNLDNFKEAEPLFRQVLKARLERLGPNHEFTLKTRHEVVHVMHQLGNRGNAEPAYREVLRDQMEILGPHHAITLVTRGNLAALLVECEAHEEAIERLLPLYRYYQADDEVTHHEMRASNNLASALNDTGQYVRALPIAETALGQKLEKLGEKDRSTHVTMFNLGETLLGLRQYHEAEVIFRDTVRLAWEYQPRRWHYLALYRGYHGHTLMRLGREHEGRPLFEKSREMLVSVPTFLEMLEELDSDAVLR